LLLLIILFNFYYIYSIKLGTKMKFSFLTINNDFYFSSFYVKLKDYFPNNYFPSSNFLTWFVGFTEGERSFIVNKRGDLAFVITQSTSDIKVLQFI